ncbi:putative nucleoprotein [Shahe heteroptera virus 3]|uniref:putative nucleoprotein n=1 Tax=Shahe heteroptera virus 3 TaxID=1923419 RepID=UPI00090A542F|nr:putative nucleoprotein [Shahe heteroptera virus 3]APG79304.1 putative nucleoprotein [Shahe heteroptera virus 3]APG79309.1 putative nucleoprotein [Shahe heteroptera virus 3]APG79320.1 putative nucleoprotein [Shahe heteroptera virus 3]
MSRRATKTSSDTEPTPAELDNARALIATWAGVTEVETSLATSDIEYQGFSPVRMLAILKNHAKATSEEVFKSEIITLGKIAMMRGSKLPKIQKNSTDALSGFMKNMIAKYKISDKRPDCAADVTMLRIAAVVALQLAYLMKKDPYETAVKPSAIHPKYPPFMCLSCFGSLIPRTELEPTIIVLLSKAFAYHQFLFDSIINKSQRSTISEIMGYVTIQMNSDLYPDSTRVAALRELGIISAGSLTAMFSDGIHEAAAKWDVLAQK